MDLKELDKTTSVFSRHPWELARLSIVKKLMLKSVKNHPKDTDLNILDFGCGDAFIVASLAIENPSFTFSGYDSFLKDNILNELNSKYRKLENLTISNALDVHQKTIQIALLLDVIEHIEDDSSFLKEMKKNTGIDSKTTFIITVPAFQSLFSNHDKFLDHYRRYSNSSLSKLLNESGYEILEMNYFFLYPLVVRVIQQFFEKKANSNDTQEQGVSNWKYGSVITGLIKNTLLLDYYIIRSLSHFGIKLPGLSLYCICRPVA